MRNINKFRFARIAIMLITYTAFSAAVMLLWNALMPQIFGLPQINYLHALGLLLLMRILFGGLGNGGWGAAGDRRHLHHDNKLREKWMNMSEDERLEFIKRERGFTQWRGFNGDDEKKDKQDE